MVINMMFLKFLIEPGTVCAHLHSSGWRKYALWFIVGPPGEVNL
jgi:hypothetical protein